MKRLILLLVLMLALTATAQSSFGQNKVSYRDHDWQVLRTEHFDLHFYPAEEELARRVAELAEEDFAELALRFDHVVRWRVPLIIYADTISFQQTNVISVMLPDGVAGFTEYTKGRVVMPNTGDLASFAITLKHELVHVFTYDVIRNSVGGRGIASYASPPLWFMEGTAEFFSQGAETAEQRLYLRDLVLEERLMTLPQLQGIGSSFIAYREGQSAVAYIAERFGEDALIALMRNCYTDELFSTVIKDTLDITLTELDADWRHWLKRRYFPEVTELVALDEVAERLTPRDELALAPAYVERDGEPGFAYLSSYYGYQSLNWLPLEGGKRIHLLTSGRDASLESLRMFSSSLDANDAGEVAFIGRRGGSDQLQVFNLNADRVTEKISLPNVISLSWPAWGEGEIAVVGLDENGRSDLYLVTVESGNIQRLTEDFFYERDPVFTPDGTAIVFSANRDTGEYSTNLDLYRYELASGEIFRIIETPWREYGAFFDNDGWLCFTSDRCGAEDIFRLEADSTLSQLTKLFTGAFHGQFTPEGELLCEGLQDYSFGIYLIDRDELVEMTPQPAEDNTIPLTETTAYTLPAFAHNAATEVVPYATEFTLDIIRSEIAFDPEFGTGLGSALALTDLTGDQKIVFQLYSYGEGFDQFFNYFNLAGTYINLKNRLNWGVGAYHYADDYVDPSQSIPYFERRYGVLGLLSYPFSRFLRLDGSTMFRRSERFEYIGESWNNRWLTSNFVSLIYDTTLWGMIGPIDGACANLTLGHTLNLSTLSTEYYSLWADLRYYLRTSRRTTLASRVIGRFAEGTDAYRLNFGGSLSVRGYPWGHFSGTRLLMGNLEWRFPFLEYIALGLPIGELAFSNIEGAFFFDAATAWDADMEVPRAEGSLGMGIRVGIGPLIALRFDLAWLTDFHTVETPPVFTFYIGWNF
jgi:hypothetical protein